MRQNADAAGQACVPLIEARAPIDYDWLSRPFGGMFIQAEQSRADGIIRYRGDAIRILTAQNQWLRHAYECAYDPVARKIVGVQIRPGRLRAPTHPAPAAQGGQSQTEFAQQLQKELVKQIRDAQDRKRRGLPITQERPRYGEPSPISVAQEHLRTPAVDSKVSVSQVSRRKARADHP